MKSKNRSVTCQPFPKRQILDPSKLKEIADDNFKFDENLRKFSKQVENTAGKGEIAHYEQFLLFPQCFQKACFAGASEGVIVWDWIKERSTGQGLNCNFKMQIVYSYLSNPLLWVLILRRKEDQSVENAGVAFVKGANERNKFFWKINNQ